MMSFLLLIDEIIWFSLSSKEIRDTLFWSWTWSRNTDLDYPKFWNVEAVGFYFVSDIFYLYVLMCPRNIVLLCFNFWLILGFSFYLFLDFFLSIHHSVLSCLIFMRLYNYCWFLNFSVLSEYIKLFLFFWIN